MILRMWFGKAWWSERVEEIRKDGCDPFERSWWLCVSSGEFFARELHLGYTAWSSVWVEDLDWYLS